MGKRWKKERAEKWRKKLEERRALKAAWVLERNTKRTRQAEGIGKIPVPITDEAQPCWKCNTPVQLHTHREHALATRQRRLREGRQPFYYEYWFSCPGCLTLYMPPEARVWAEAGRETERVLA